MIKKISIIKAINRAIDNNNFLTTYLSKKEKNKGQKIINAKEGDNQNIHNNKNPTNHGRGDIQGRRINLNTSKEESTNMNVNQMVTLQNNNGVKLELPR